MNPHSASQPNRLLWLALSLGLAGGPPAAAASYFYQTPFEVAAQFKRFDTRLRDAQGADTVTVRRAGVRVYEDSAARLQPGLLIGYALLDGGGAPAGMEPRGFYAAPSLRGILWAGPRLRLSLSGVYLYQWADDEQGSQRLRVEWEQVQLEGDLQWRITPRARLSLGGVYGRISTSERAEGPVQFKIKRHAGPQFGGRYGLEFNVGDDGQVGALWHDHLEQGIEIYFQRQF